MSGRENIYIDIYIYFSLVEGIKTRNERILYACVAVKKHDARRK